MTDFAPQRKRPIHLPARHRHNTPIIQFLTFCVRPRLPVLANTAFAAAFRQACLDANAWSVGRFVIMPDHLHLFCQPARDPEISIKTWASFLKRRITIHHAVTDGSRDARPPVRWQADCWDTQMRSQEHYRERWEYMRQNPVRAGLVTTADDWPWQGEIAVLAW